MSKNEMIMLPREVVERALDALAQGCPQDCKDGMTDSGGVHPWGEAALIECPSCQAVEALRAALEQSQGEQAPVAWCALNADRSGIAYFDGRPIIMTGPIGNEHHPDPLYTKPQPKREPPQADPAPYLYYDPENGDTWTQEAINDGCCLPDGLIALYTK